MPPSAAYRLVILLAATTYSILGSDTPAIGADYSDMAQVSENTFITVNDRKNPIQPGNRVSLLTITKVGGITETAITVGDWKDKDGEPSDLEACCRIPQRQNEFLLAESGLYKGKFGRVFHVTLVMDQATPTLVVNGVMRIYDRKLDDNKSSFEGDWVEGIQCFEAFGKTLLAFGERGGATLGEKKLGTIVWGEVDFMNYKFVKRGESQLVPKSILCARDCSALHLVPKDDGSFSVLSVATEDPGNNGPYISVIYCAGRFVLNEDKKSVTFVRQDAPAILAKLPGIKVEGLAPPALIVPDSSYSVSTDDEYLGGIWRPIKVPGR